MANIKQGVQLDSQVIEVVAEFARIKAELRKLESMKAQVETVIYEALRGTDRGFDGEGNEVVVVSHRTRKGVDAKRIETEFPAVFAATNKVTKYDVLMTP